MPIPITKAPIHTAVPSSNLAAPAATLANTPVGLLHTTTDFDSTAQASSQEIKKTAATTSAGSADADGRSGRRQ